MSRVARSLLRLRIRNESQDVNLRQQIISLLDFSARQTKDVHHRHINLICVLDMSHYLNPLSDRLGVGGPSVTEDEF